MSNYEGAGYSSHRYSQSPGGTSPSPPHHPPPHVPASIVSLRPAAGAAAPASGGYGGGPPGPPQGASGGSFVSHSHGGYGAPLRSYSAVQQGSRVTYGSQNGTAQQGQQQGQQQQRGSFASQGSATRFHQGYSASATAYPSYVSYSSARSPSPAPRQQHVVYASSPGRQQGPPPQQQPFSTQSVRYVQHPQQPQPQQPFYAPPPPPQPHVMGGRPIDDIVTRVASRRGVNPYGPPPQSQQHGAPHGTHSRGHRRRRGRRGRDGAGSDDDDDEAWMPRSRRGGKRSESSRRRRGGGKSEPEEEDPARRFMPKGEPRVTSVRPGRVLAPAGANQHNTPATDPSAERRRDPDWTPTRQHAEYGIHLFNTSRKIGIEYLQDCRILSFPLEPHSVSALFANYAGISRTVISEYLSQPAEFNAEVARSYIARTFDFRGKNILVAMREFFAVIPSPPEGQQVSRLLNYFAEHFFLQATPGTFMDQDAVHGLSESLLFLQTTFTKDKSIHLSQNAFIESMEGANGGYSYPAVVLKDLYRSLKKKKIEGPKTDYTGEVPKKKGFFS